MDSTIRGSPVESEAVSRDKPLNGEEFSVYLFIVWAKGPPGGLGTIRETFLQTSVHVLYVNCVNGTGIEY